MLNPREALRKPVQDDETDDGKDRGHGGDLIFFVINFFVVVQIVFDIAQFIAISFVAMAVANVRAIEKVGVGTN